MDDEEFKQAETEGGYAKEMSANYKAKQDELVAEHLRSQDIVITTALIPGRPAPILINSDMVKTLRPGAIIVDLAVERGGNCELSKPGKGCRKAWRHDLGPAQPARGRLGQRVFALCA